MFGNVTRTRCYALLVSFMLATVFGVLSCTLPCSAYAQNDALATATMADETISTQEPQIEAVEAAPKASLKYAVFAGKPWVKGANGTAASVTKGKKLSGLYLKLSSKLKGSIQYQVYVHGYGWQSVRSNGKAAGRTGKNAKRFDAVRIALTGEVSKWYSVEYRVKSANGTWQAWTRSGQAAGKSGGGALRGIQVRLKERPQKSSQASEGLVNVRYRIKQPGTVWQAWVANNTSAGEASEHKRIKNFAIALDKGTSSGGIMYRVRLADGSWNSWKKNGKAVGSYSDIEAIQVKLTGKLAKTYDVVYRVYVRGVGWQARVRNGATAGTSKGRKVESMRVQLVKKTARDGWVGSGTSWSYYKNGKKKIAAWVQTKESPINVMTAKSKRYWLDASGKLAVKRIVDPKTTRDAKAGFASYATKWGYVLVNGKQKTSKGYVLAGENGALVSKSGWVRTDAIDSFEETYRMKNVGSYSVAVTGFFTVNGKKYYADADEVFIMRDMTFKVGDLWYTAKHNGVVGAASSAEKRIERYVRWAINIANDDSHGYSWDIRWGPDYDCSSLVISALKNTGLSTGDATYTGNMRSELTPRGFVWHTDLSMIKRGDILLVHREGGRQHTEIYIGKGRTVGAHINEFGGVYGGRLGDQTGHEIDIGPYENIWQGFLRFGS